MHKAETRQRINLFTSYAKGVVISTLQTVRNFGSTEEFLKEFYCSVLGLITTWNNVNVRQSVHQDELS